MDKLYLPQVMGRPGSPSGQDGDEVEALIRDWLVRLGRRADFMTRDERLMRCARDHAAYLESREGEEDERSMHIGKGGTTPNERVRAAGFTLPSWWHKQANNVEACCFTKNGPARCLDLWWESDAHRPLVWGQKVSEWFWHRHTAYGVASLNGFYVLLAAPPEGSME